MLPIVERPLFGVAGFVAAAGFVGVFSASPANATLFQTNYTFDVDYCSTGCLNGGTGGTLGSRYLLRTIDQRFFPKLWEVRSKFFGRR